jgi:hypothetical protein
MAEPDDSHFIPTEIGLPQAEQTPLPVEPLSDSAIQNLLGPALTPPTHGRTRRVWQPPSVEKLQAGFPQYEIVAMIGRGGMGAVYKGWQRSLDRFVAIKILPPEIEDATVDFAARFQREGKAMARFKHPGIVAVYDAGQTPDGLLYLVMEYVEGTDVGQMLAAQGRLPAEHALSIATHVCAALDYAHGRGVIHRDIKPSNVLLDSDATVKVADFGLAKNVTQETATHTRSDISMGTPDYMPPEALTPGVKVDHRADLYALGAMLYQMLTGSPPRGRFAAASACVPGLDPRVDAIVDKALQPDREQRYASAAEMRAELEKVVRGFSPPDPANTTRSDSTQRSGPKPRTTLLIAAAVVVVAILAVAIFRHRGDPSPGGPPSVVAQTSAGEAGGKVGADGASPSKATKDAPFVNTLGMKFVPVPIAGGPTGGRRVLFSVWETRVQDYEAFANETQRDWQKPDFDQGPTHPTVKVSWDDATAFCAWLTEREHKAGTLAPGVSYRLPSDHEWSCAFGIGAQEDADHSPGKKSESQGQFLWGTGLVPSPGAGNFKGEECAFMNTGFIAGYRDDYINTAPVGSFTPNSLGLYDLAGNVGEWCADLERPGAQDRVVRGATFHDSDPDQLRSRKRAHYPPEARFAQRGFRCVLAEETEGAREGASVSPSRSPQVSPSSTASAGSPPLIPLWDSSRALPLQAGIRWEDSAVRVEKTSLRNLSPKSRDVILRASVLMDPNVGNSQLLVRSQAWRNEGDRSRSYGLQISSDGHKVALINRGADEKKYLMGWPLPRSYAPTEWLRLELRAVGDAFTVFVEGQLMGTVHDSSLVEPGIVELTTQSVGYFKDVAYVSLDNTAETEALNLGGVSGDAPKPAAQTVAAGLPVAPAGYVWQRVFQDREDKDGWITLSSSELREFHELTDCALRLELGQRCEGLRLDLRRTELDGAYALHWIEAKGVAAVKHRARGGLHQMELARFPIGDVLKTPLGQKVEFWAIGSRLTAILNGKSVGTLEATALKSGGFAVYADKLQMRNVEVLGPAALAGQFDTKPPGVPTSVSGATTAPAPLPTGVWQPVQFTTVEADFPDRVRLVAPGEVRTQRGLIFLPGAPVRDGGVRGKVRLAAGALNTRATLGAGRPRYGLHLQFQPSEVAIKVQEKDVHRDLCALPRPMDAGADGWVAFEFIHLDGQLYGRVNGQPLPPARLSAPELFLPGRAALYSSDATFKDLEVINLDSLPAAEARKLIGVP